MLDEEVGEMIFQNMEHYADTTAGFEVCRTSLYGSELAHSLGLVMLTSPADANIYAPGEEVLQLKAEAEGHYRSGCEPLWTPSVSYCVNSRMPGGRRRA